MTKTNKTALLLIAIVFLFSIPNAVEAKHCSHTKTLEEKLQCAVDPSKWNKTESSSHEVKDTKEDTKKDTKKEKKVKKERGGEEINTLEKLFKKLKLKK